MDASSTIELSTGRAMPVIGLGTWELTEDTAEHVAEALRLGYRMIDTSGDYGTQPGVGEALRETPVDRSEIYVTTKVEENEDAYDATLRDLEELGQDYVDLMLIHRPPPIGSGLELWKDLIRAREHGRTRDIGVSNYSIAQIQVLEEGTGDLPAVNQIEWSPFGWSREMLDYCRSRRIVIQAYSPLTRAERLDNGTLRHVADRHGKTPGQVVLRWHLQMGVVPLPKATSRAHQAENLDLFDFELSQEDMAEVNALNEHWSALGAGLQYEQAAH